MTLLAVILELADVVDEEEVGGGDGLGRELEVEIDREAEPPLAEPIRAKR